MSFYFAEIKNIAEESIRLEGAEQRYLAKVMRAKKGERVSVTDGAGMVYDCIISKKGRDYSELQIITRRRNVGEPERTVTLALGLSASSKFESILSVCAEIGVSGFAPLLSEESKIKIDDKARVERKLRRWREVLKLALKQSMRSRLPEISTPQDFDGYVRQLQDSPIERIIAHPGVTNSASVDAAGALSKRLEPLIILVGPESGFSTDEFELAVSAGFLPLSLGERILGAESAASALASLALLGRV
ncbi:MAG: 16S rRNA (uracil(1498)-N(3))-methyltransferase [candidate division Zixibacteria bacterium]|nr:16S rRNA (uracil(1498)-N(3))-methyltransferase [candidate division Zixibacteria bacterium]